MMWLNWWLLLWLLLLLCPVREVSTKNYRYPFGKYLHVESDDSMSFKTEMPCDRDE